MNLQSITGRTIGIALAILMLFLVPQLSDFGGDPRIANTAAVAAFMSVLWITEAVPLAATALMPLIAFPFLGILSGKAVADSYVNSTIFLFIGGFLIALAMEKWNLHRRIALSLLAFFGGTPGRIAVGFITATAFLSMWVSNTATTIAMLPVAMAIISRFESYMAPAEVKRFSTGLLLSIAYSASVGGMMTLVGTAPNLVFARIYEIGTSASEPVSFAQWMGIGLPVGIAMLLLLTVYMMLIFFRKLQFDAGFEKVIDEERKALGRMGFEEKAVAVVFALTALLWITRKGIDSIGLPGWQGLFEHGQMIDDGTVAIGMAVILFFIPAIGENRGNRLLDQTVFSRLPWGIVLLFGGGFALASGFVESGLSAWLASKLQGLAGASPSTLILAIAAMMSFLTELTSNTATTQLVLPLLNSTAEAVSMPPLLLMLPATLAASLAFMLPVATPPNAIVFGSGRLRVIDMVKTGFILNLIGISVVTLATLLLAPTVFSL